MRLRFLFALDLCSLYTLLMRFAYKYRLYPNQAQVRFLENQLLYNAALQERRDAWKVCRKSIHYYDQAKQLKPIREEGLLGLANFSCCQDVLRRVDKTFQAFFARVRRGEKPGFPRFRSFRRCDSITFPSYGDGCRLLEDGNNGSSTFCMPRHSSTACSSRLWK